MYLALDPILHTIFINIYPYFILDEFAIDAESGVMTVVGDLDEEHIDMYALTVQAENDQATGAPPVTVREYNNSLQGLILECLLLFLQERGGGGY